MSDTNGQTLTVKERSEFDQLHTVVERGLGTFVEVGRALAKIRDGKLYRDNYDNFESYIRTAHELGRSRAYQLIDSASVMDDLSTICGQNYPILPKSEAQCRELVDIPREDLPNAWQSVCEHREETGDTVTAKVIRQITAPYRVTGSDDTEDDTPSAFDEDAAGYKIRDWLRAELHRWPEDVRHEAAHWVRQVLEKEFGL